MRCFAWAPTEAAGCCAPCQVARHSARLHYDASLDLPIVNMSGGPSSKEARHQATTGLGCSSCPTCRRPCCPTASCPRNRPRCRAQGATPPYPPAKRVCNDAQPQPCKSYIQVMVCHTQAHTRQRECIRGMVCYTQAHTRHNLSTSGQSHGAVNQMKDTQEYDQQCRRTVTEARPPTTTHSTDWSPPPKNLCLPTSSLWRDHKFSEGDAWPPISCCNSQE